MQEKTAPNILFLFPDQLRWDWLGCDDTVTGSKKPAVRTPNIDALAARGTRFTQCRTNSPLCVPARAALAMGKRYHRCDTPDNNVEMDDSKLTVFQLLRSLGYRVGTTGKNDIRMQRQFKGLDGWMPRLGRLGFTEAIDHSGKLDAMKSGWPTPSCAYTSLLHRHGLMKDYVDDYQRRGAQMTITTADWPSPLPRRFYTDDVCGQNSVQMLENFPLQGPWSLWVNWPGPHSPFDPPRSLQQLYDAVNFPDPVNPDKTITNGLGETKEINHQQIRRNYAAQIEGIDQWVGRIIDSVEQRGELDNTIIIFGSDHGEMLGDHGRFSKRVAKEGSVRVPLIMAGPGIKQGKVSNALVELIDISATMLDFAGIDVPEDWDARSLLSVLTGAASDSEHRKFQISQLNSGNENWKLVCDGRFKFIKHEAQEDELYDLNSDPQEQNNIIADNPDKVKQLSAALQKELSS